MHVLSLFPTHPSEYWEFVHTVTVNVDGSKTSRLAEQGLLWIAIKFTKYPNGDMEIECQLDGSPYGFDDNPARVHWHPNGMVQGEIFYYGGVIGAHGRPAVVWYYDNGAKQREYWFCRGKIDNGDKPALIFYNPDGSICQREWFVNGKSVRKERFQS